MEFTQLSIAQVWANVVHCALRRRKVCKIMRIILVSRCLSDAPSKAWLVMMMSKEFIMSDDLVDVYEANTLADAQLLVTRLEEVGIESFVDNTDSPFDGLTAMLQQKIVRVLPNAEVQARQVVEKYVAEQGSSGEV